ncbi:MAG TPA: hypothetical protein VHE35_29825 [Kofleriaceae bacterium]|nr:hypothetical protein [Kofleriaceae bacterium]
MRARAVTTCLVASALVGVVLAAFAVAGLVAPAAGDVTSYKIIVHPDNPVKAVDASFLRDAYLKKAGEWPGGLAVHPLDLSPRSPVRTQFVREVLRKTPLQLRSYWNQQIFSGKRVPPPHADTPAAAIAYVLANAGAVAYIPADVDPGRAKVVSLE